MMRIYQINPTEDAARIELLSDMEFVQSAIESPKQFPDSIKLRATQIPFEGGAKQKVRDVTFIDYTRTMPVFSESLYTQLVDTINLDVQWRPVDVDGDTYYLLNIVALINAIDADKSVIENVDMGDRVVVKADELVMNEDAIGERWLFRDQLNKSRSIYCSKDFVEWFEQCGFNGVYFKPVYDPAYKPFKLAPYTKDVLARPDVYGPGGLFPRYLHHFENKT